MISLLNILLPIFGLILTGFLARRSGMFGHMAASELNRFVARLALPALLFHFTANAHWSELYQPGFTAAFALASLIVFATVLVWRLVSRHALADASLDAIAASYSNTAYIGIPLCTMLFGMSSMAEVTIASIWVVCVMFAIAIVLIEAGQQAQPGGWKRAAGVLVALAKNPLISAPALGILFALTKLSIPAGVTTYLDLLGMAAAPCALISIGLFLAGKFDAGSLRTALPLTLAKLIAMPAIAWLLATQLFRLSPEQVRITLILAALPTGTGPFMLAELYRREARASSQTILLSTVGSLLTLSLILLLI